MWARALLTSDWAALRTSARTVDVADVLHWARTQGLLPLVAHQILSLSDRPAWAEPVVDSLAAIRRSSAIVEELRRAELTRALGALASGGVDAIVVKGTALAYTHYPEPWLRPRRDTDLLIRDRDVAATKEMLARLGYTEPPFVTDDDLINQFQMVRTDAHGVQHALDVHWRVSNMRVFADMLRFEEAWEEAVPVPLAQGGVTRGLSPVHALLLACVHRVAHHADGGDLVWIYDIHLIAAGLSTEEWHRFPALALDRGMARVCRRGLDLAREWFGTPAPPAILGDLDTAGDETSARFLGGFRQIDVLRSDWARLRGWRRRAGFLRAHLLPPPSYMQTSYGTSSRLWLPVLYVHRVVRGAWRALHRLDEGG